MTAFKKLLSTVLGPLVFSEIKGDSKSQKLFTKFGLMRFDNGMGTLSPLLVRSLRKLEKIVRKDMEGISAVEIILPTLTQLDLFKKSGRLDFPDLYKVGNTKKDFYVLNPTCEEAITDYMSGALLSYKQLPCRVYQISNKFRDEKRAKSGLLRSREFVMKDLYCFDSSAETSEATYIEVINKYHDFFKRLGVPYTTAHSTPGIMGGLKSQEFHFFTDSGQDKLILCQNCGHNENLECDENDTESTEYKCKKCGNKIEHISKGIEVAHAFSLGTRYSEPFDALFTTAEDKKELLHMSCFGLGLTRILAASVECLATDKGIRWPRALSPYLLCLVPPKEGSQEEAGEKNASELLYQSLSEAFHGDVIVDDRTYLTIGKRLYSLKNMGFPFIVVVGKHILDDTPTVEVLDVNAATEDLVQVPDVVQFILNKVANISEMGFGIEKEKYAV